VQAASTRTDDRGEYRLSGLQPGTYMVRASSTDTWDGDDGATTHAYTPTYFPGVAGVDQAQTVNVSAGQEIANVTFMLRPGRTARVTGVLQNAAGEPLAARNVSISLFTRGVNGGPAMLGGPGSGNARTDASGRFEFPHLAPAEYAVSFSDGPEQSRVTVPLGDGDLRQVVLMPQKPGVLRGTVVSDDGAPLPFGPTRLRIEPIATDAESVFPSFWAPRGATIGADWSFRFNDIGGQYLLRVTGLPDDWMLRAVNANGRDTTDTPLTISAGTDTMAQIVLTRSGARLAGEVVTRDGAPAPDSTVLVFANDPSRWTIASRFVHAVRPDSAGRFAVGGLPPGQYRAIAREYVADGQWEDPDFLRQLSPDAVRVDLDDGAARTLTLRLEPPR
jgi:hypothetical protein